MASETVAQKAIGYGAHGIQVDGNDLFAVYKATRDARERARAGGGVTLIEAVTYRLGDHTTADDARRYRDQAEVDLWKARDPITRIRNYMKERKLWNDSKEAALKEKVE